MGEIVPPAVARDSPGLEAWLRVRLATDDGDSQLSLLLEQLRHKLLDLTGHNKLLNFHHRESNCLRAVDELPDQLSRCLYDGKKLYFEAVPPPSEREIQQYDALDMSVPRAGIMAAKPQRPPPGEWAQRLGISVRYELPVDTADVRDPKHDDDRIQTLLYPDSLAARLRKLQGDAQTAIEESGVNMLYMAFGFLDWREPAKQDKACLAPLMLVPVELRKEGTKDGSFRYSVAWTGEDLQTNLSLQKKLLQDFHLRLPDLENEDTPEAYFDRVREMIGTKVAWGVRRFVTLTLFNFGKQLIYLDLDPARWANVLGGGLSGSPLVRRLLLGDDTGSSGNHGEELPLDARAIDLDLALVDRADSTQAAALIGALSGRSMVIQGPPGTGKSQTITNLIGAALAAGKTVLFVSEKLAALEVVKRRLDEIGFGPFCLELHSHKTRRQALYDRLRERLALTAARAPESLERTQRDLASERDMLTEYVVQIREPVGALGWPASRVLFKAGDARRKAGALARLVKMRENFNALDVDEDAYERARRKLAALAEAARLLSCQPADHPWCGVSSEMVMEFDVQDVVAAGRQWEEALYALDDALRTLRRLIDVGQQSDDALCAKARIASDKIPVLAAVDEAFATATGLIAHVRAVLGRDFGNFIGQGIDAVSRLHAIVGLAAAAPPRGSLANRCDELRRAEADAALSKLAEVVKKAYELREALEKTFRLDKAMTDDLSGAAACAIASALKIGWIFSVFSARGRRARRLAREYSKVDGKRLSSREFEIYAVLCGVEHKLAHDTALREAIGPAFAGLETDVDGLMACRTWFVALQDRFGNASSQEAQLGQALWEADPAAIDFLARLADHPQWPAVEHVWKFFNEHEASRISQCDFAAPWVPVLVSVCGREFVNALVKARAAVGWPQIEECLRAVMEAQLSADQAKTAFCDPAGLDQASWWRPALPQSVQDRRARVQRALAEPGALVDWLSFDRAARAAAIGETRMEAASDVARQAMTGQVPFDRLVEVWDHIFFDALARAVFATRPIVRKLGLKQHQQIRKHYRALDERVMELRRDRIAHDLAQRPVSKGRSGAKVGDFTDLELIKREIGKKKRHLPIRKLVGRAGLALQALKPCFMMGPMSVAQFLPPEDLSFDLVIFDEASQVRPEDAIGAIARGRQIVVVGDGNQLPPTNFFQRLNIDDAVDDGTPDGQGSDALGVGAIAESILDLAESRFPCKRLLWHYRSAHESLIVFSNRSFYDGNLLIFPSPARSDPRLGIEFNLIENGIFDKGRNHKEAERVADAAAAFLREHPNRSLGVVAMNVEQTALIRELLEERMRHDPTVLIRAEDYEQQTEPFFIKNLENVQGDERDVIMISMTYGPATEGGRVMQRFGPINQEDGWRRLNVLFTRAKERMEVFSSMCSSDVILSDVPSRGIQTLRSFLEYAKTGRLEPQAGSIGTRPPGSDFEIAVRDGLCSLGYACDTQVGASGFFIDLAVRDPEQPGRYLLGIECDGATYHSTPSARDRDRLRQDILEDKLGWIIERVWSTDWFRDPDAQLERLRQRIEDLRLRARRPPASADEAVLEEAENEQQTVIAAVPAAESETPEPRGALALLERRPDSPKTKPQTASPQRISLEIARRLLLDLRENEIKPAFPNSDPARGLLRKSMIDALIRMKPTSANEFRLCIPLDLREKTDREQFRAFGNKVFSILEQIRHA